MIKVMTDTITNPQHSISGIPSLRGSAAAGPIISGAVGEIAGVTVKSG